MELPDPPEGWALTHLINLGECWQANIASEEAVIIASGTSPRYALLTAIERIGNARYERIKISAKPIEIDLVKELGIKAPRMERRF